MNTTTTQPKPKVTAGRAAGGLGILAAFALILGTTLDLEGGYVNDPVDPGGETNHGVTIGTARESGFTGNMRDLRRECDYPILLQNGIAETLDAAAREEVETDSDGDTKCAEQILFEGYVERPGFIPLVVIDPWVAKEVIDTAVNMGPSRPSRYFQRSVNRVCGTTLRADGAIGRVTVKAWQDCRENLGPRACVAMIRDLDRQQRAEYDRLVRVRPSLRRFHRGWVRHRIGNVDTRNCGKAMA